MQRRTLLKRLAIGIPGTALGAAVAGAAIRSTGYVKETSEQSLAALRKNVDELRERMDRMDAKDRKLVRIALGLAALSLGIDVSLLL